MDTDTDYVAIRVPITWAGICRTLKDGRSVFACGGCQRPDACAASGECARANPEDFERGLPGAHFPS